MKNILLNVNSIFRKGRSARLTRKLLAMDDDLSPWINKHLDSFSHAELTEALKEAFPCLKTYIQKKLLFLLEEAGYIRMLLDGLVAQDEEKKLFALEMVALLKPPRVLSLVYGCLADKKERVRFEAAHCLICYNDQRIIKEMVQELKADSLYMPARIGQVLIGYGPASLKVLLDNLENPRLEAGLIVELLLQIEDSRIEELLKEHLSSPSKEVRAAVLRYYAKNPKPKHQWVFEDALQDEEEAVRAQALKGLDSLKYIEQHLGFNNSGEAKTI
jgi:HEAT repeat protein